MASGEEQVSNRNGSQGEQPPAALARTESPDGLEDQEEMVRLEGIEPPHQRYVDLNHARLPVPPQPHF